MNRRALGIALILAWICGCNGRDYSESTSPTIAMDPLAVQQLKAYPETVTGRFVSLIDFEDSPADGARGFDQVEMFSIRPHHQEAMRKFVVNITRTGAGAMEVTLPAGSELVFTIPGYRDFSGYSLLSVAIYSEALRDDLRLRVTTDGSSWVSHRTLVKPNWNTVLIDIQRLELLEGFDITGVRSIGISFADAAGTVRFNLDDIMLIDNKRTLGGTPKGITLRKEGLNYSISIPHRNRPILIRQCSDGLWRADTGQPTIQIASPGVVLGPEGEHLEIMGQRKNGHIEVLEVNSVRVRLSNTWYFPTRSGEWVSLAVRKIRWEYTFYGDGRWVTHVELNNAGGKQIGSVRMWVPDEVAWSDGVISRDLVIRDFAGPLGRWSFLIAPKGLQKKTMHNNHLFGGIIRPHLAASEVFAPGDYDKDRYDESQGCYFLESVKGHCRFRIDPPTEGLLNPVFLVAGQWKRSPIASSQGLRIRNLAYLDDGSVLFLISGWIRRSTAVEVAGETVFPVRQTGDSGR